MQITLRQVATYFGVDESLVRRWIADRDLPVHRASERLYLNAIEVWEWAVERGITVSRNLLDDARKTPEAVPSLSGLLAAGGLHRDVEGNDKAAILASVVQRLPLPPDVDREHLLAILEAREAMGSTGIGDGLAIPHVRNPILLHVNQPQVSLFLLSQPVDFDSLDQLPVHSVFVVISSTIPVHLRILARLGFALRDVTLRDLLRRRAPNEQILARIAEVERSTGEPATTRDSKE